MRRGFLYKTPPDKVGTNEMEPPSIDIGQPSRTAAGFRFSAPGTTSCFTPAPSTGFRGFVAPTPPATPDTPTSFRLGETPRLPNGSVDWRTLGDGVPDTEFPDRFTYLLDRFDANINLVLSSPLEHEAGVVERVLLPALENDAAYEVLVNEMWRVVSIGKDLGVNGVSTYPAREQRSLALMRQLQEYMKADTHQNTWAMVQADMFRL